MPPKKRFQAGDSLTELTADWLNSVESRISKLENIGVAGSIELRQTIGGRVFQLTQRIDNFILVQLTEELTALGSATANLLRWTESGGDAEDTNNQYTVYDMSNLTTADNTKGIAFKHPHSEKERWIYVPLECP